MDLIKNSFSNVRASPKKYLSLFGGLFCMLSMAPFFLITSTSPYYISYMRKYLGSSVRYSDVVFVSTVFNTFNSLASILAGILNYKFNVKLKYMAIFGCILLK